MNHKAVHAMGMFANELLSAWTKTSVIPVFRHLLDTLKLFSGVKELQQNVAKMTQVSQQMKF